MGEESAGNDEDDRLPAGAWWMLGVVSFVSLIDWADRALISVVIEPIRHEFALSDTQLGLLAGFAFSVLYLVAIVIIGRLADRWNRRNIIAISLGIWSTMTLAFGAAGNVVQLFVTRMGIGVGSAGGAAPALSMISDVFPAQRRSVAMSIFQVGGVVGFSLGAMIGGAVTESHGWRYAMIGFGLFGMIVACLMVVTISEPRRRVAKTAAGSSPDIPSLKETAIFMLAQKSLLHFAFATVLVYFVEAIVNFWTYSYFIRSHGMSIGEASAKISILWIISGIPGTVLGGIIADRLSGVDLRGPVWMCVAIPPLAGLCSIPLYLSTSSGVALTMLFVYNFIYNMWYGPMYSVPAALLRSRMRAIGFAIMSFCRTLVGAGGPLFTGFINDRLESSMGAESIRWGMLAGSVFLLWGALHVYLATRTYREDYARNPDG